MLAPKNPTVKTVGVVRDSDIFENMDQFVHFLEYSEGYEFKPYLRSMGTMTENESLEYEQLCKNLLTLKSLTYCWEIVDWLNAHHFDHRFLIDNDLALEAPEGMYKTK